MRGRFLLAVVDPAVRRRWLLGAAAAGLMVAGSVRREAVAAEKDERGAVVVQLEGERGGPRGEVDNFGRFMRFGMVDMSILLMSLVAGVSFDAVIARYVGVAGYGPIVGAGLGNVAADVIAGLPEGLYASVGVGVGAALPLLPLALPMLLKMPFTRPISLAFGLSSLGFCITAFVWGYEHHNSSSSHPPVEEQTRILLLEIEGLVKSHRIDEAIAVLETKRDKV